jgi:hypothetical protein
MTHDHKSERVFQAAWALIEEMRTANKELGIDRPKELTASYDRCDVLENALLHMRAPTNEPASLEMVVGSVEVDDAGNKKINYFVKMSNGRTHVLYPWDALRETVEQWISIENNSK